MLELLVAADLVRKKTTKALATEVPSRPSSGRRASAPCDPARPQASAGLQG